VRTRNIKGQFENPNAANGTYYRSLMGSEGPFHTHITTWSGKHTPKEHRGGITELPRKKRTDPTPAREKREVWSRKEGKGGRRGLRTLW